MKGRKPKPPSLRKGHHRRSACAMLPTEAEAASQEVPPLCPRPRGGKWHLQVIAWWESVWRSPMAAEYIEVDKHGLFMVAVLKQDFETASAKDRARYAAEIRRWEEKFGLDPVSRRRLEWAIEKGETAAVQTQARRQRKMDPRAVLKILT